METKGKTNISKRFASKIISDKDIILTLLSKNIQNYFTTKQLMTIIFFKYTKRKSLWKKMNTLEKQILLSLLP